MPGTEAGRRPVGTRGRSESPLRPGDGPHLPFPFAAGPRCRLPLFASSRPQASSKARLGPPARSPSSSRKNRPSSPASSRCGMERGRFPMSPASAVPEAIISPTPRWMPASNFPGGRAASADHRPEPSHEISAGQPLRFHPGQIEVGVRVHEGGQQHALAQFRGPGFGPAGEARRVGSVTPPIAGEDLARRSHGAISPPIDGHGAIRNGRGGDGKNPGAGKHSHSPIMRERPSYLQSA